jgi:hypothetical protein
MKTMKANAQSKSEISILERCGYCGRYFRGKDFLSAEELIKTSTDDLGDAPMGYCPDAGYEAQEAGDEKNMVQVTADMASDACDPNLEGTWIEW